MCLGIMILCLYLARPRDTLIKTSFLNIFVMCFHKICDLSKLACPPTSVVIIQTFNGLNRTNIKGNRSPSSFASCLSAWVETAFWWPWISGLWTMTGDTSMVSLGLQQIRQSCRIQKSTYKKQQHFFTLTQATTKPIWKENDSLQ